MKKQIKRVVLCMMTLVLCLCFSKPVRVNAEMQTSYFTTRESAGDMVIEIGWETEQPEVIFISPNGEYFNPSMQREDTITSIGTDTMFYYIQNARIGEWKVMYDKKSNEYITIDEVKNTGLFVVDDVAVYDIGDMSATVAFQAVYETEHWYQYEIYLSASENNRGELISSGSATTNEMQEVQIDLERFGSSSNYRVYIYAFFETDGIDIADGVYSAPFTFRNSRVQQATTPSSIVIIPQETAVRVNWEPQWGMQYLLAMFTKEEATGWGSEPLAYVEIENSDETEREFQYDEAQAIRIEFSEQQGNDVFSEPKSMEVEPGKLPVISFEDIELTNKSDITMHYEGFTNRCEATVSVGEQEEIVFLEGTGDLNIALPEDYSTVVVKYQYAEDVYVEYTKEVFRDVDAPRIYMVEDYTKAVTNKESYIIAGTVTGQDSFTIGGEEIAVNSDGTFLYELKLNPGRNDVPVVASDMAGNNTLYNISIQCTPDGVAEDGQGGSGNTTITPKQEAVNAGRTYLEIVQDKLGGVGRFLPGIVALVAAIVMSVIAAITWKKDKKAPVTKSLITIFIVFAVAGFLFTVYEFLMWLKLFSFNMKAAFSKVASSSLNTAFDLLEQEKYYRTTGFIGLGVTLAFVAALVVTIIVAEKKKNKDQNKEK